MVYSYVGKASSLARVRLVARIVTKSNLLARGVHVAIVTTLPGRSLTNYHAHSYW